jgi:hypothetical protein
MPFMEQESSLPATGPYPEPHKSNPHPYNSGF